MELLTPFIIAAFAALLLLLRRTLFKPRTTKRDLIPPFSQTHIRKP